MIVASSENEPFLYDGALSFPSNMNSIATKKYFSNFSDGWILKWKPASNAELSDIDQRRTWHTDY